VSGPLVSVVIPNHNYGRFLSQALESVFAQTYRRVEVLVVDDGSTDGSLEVMRRYEGRIRSAFQANAGVSRARNLGVRESRGELIAFLDSDDWWLEEKLAKQVSLIESGRFGMVYTGLRFVSEEGVVRGETRSGLSGWVLRDLALLEKPGIPASGSSALIRRECLDAVGCFDPDLSTSADWDLWRRIACRYPIGRVPEPLTCYRLHPAAMHRDLRLFERDMLLAFGKMFRDEAAREAHPLERRAKARLFLTFAGSYFRARKWDKFLGYCGRSLALDPGGVLRLALHPFRRFDPSADLGLLERTVGR
jgi:glycosyltransferase involved in cell wall biosynthesis